VSTDGFTKEEKAAMRAKVAEEKAQKTRADGEKAVAEAIKAMPKADRELAQFIHDTVTKQAPHLAPRTWYGMPAYANDEGVVCFFQAADKFKARYATFGFNDKAQLDDGAMWATGFALKELTAESRKKIEALVKKAAG